jgi:site-specific recombinase XerD
VLTIPVYCRDGIYYLHTRVGGQQFKRSLGTRDPVQARLIALRLLESIYMSKPKLSDFDFSGRLNSFELDLSKGLAKAEGAEDFARMLKAIESLAPLYKSTPQPPQGGVSSLNDQGSSLRLLEVLNKMIGLRKNLSTATVTSYKNTVSEFAKFIKNPQIHMIGTGDVTRYQEFLSNKNNSLRTIDNKIATLRALFNFAKKQGYYLAENPAEDRRLLSKKDKIKSGYAIFEEKEIMAIFASEFLKTQKTKSPDYYWVLVLTLISGCRVGEITGLTVPQIKIEKDFFTLKITDSKTLAGIREVPIPLELMEMGFENFLKNKTEGVFKYNHRPGKGAGNAAGKMFRRNLESVKINNPKLVYHSLRKFTNDFFQKFGVEFEPRCQFFGHEIDNVNVNFYTKKYTANQLFEITKSAQKALIEMI